ncbi:MAG: hypothetical protein M9904_18130 [Chitinophagaceae bacterium]|nr:hypothetical protein [Chitinophagaceae bacterium]
MEFKFFIGGYLGGHFEVMLHKNDLYFFVSDHPMVRMPDTLPDYIVSIKDDEDWLTLIKFMTALNWKEKYFDNDILDGTQWEFDFKSDNKELHCFGSNQYPADFNEFTKRLCLITQKHKIHSLSITVNM